METQVFDTKNVLEKDEFDTVSNYIFTSFTLHNESAEQTKLQEKAENIQTYIGLLDKMLLNNAFKSKKIKADVLHFLTKLQHQKEVLEFSKNTSQLEEYQKAANSFSQQTSINA